MSHPTVFFYPRPRVDVAEVPAASHAGAVLLTDPSLVAPTRRPAAGDRGRAHRAAGPARRAHRILVAGDRRLRHRRPSRGGGARRRAAHAGRAGDDDRLLTFGMAPFETVAGRPPTRGVGPTQGPWIS